MIFVKEGVGFFVKINCLFILLNFVKMVKKVKMLVNRVLEKLILLRINKVIIKDCEVNIIF